MRILGVSKRTMWLWATQGKAPTARPLNVIKCPISEHLYIHEEDVQRLRALVTRSVFIVDAALTWNSSHKRSLKYPIPLLVVWDTIIVCFGSLLAKPSLRYGAQWIIYPVIG